MGTTTMYTLLFVGNAALFFLWAHHILRIARGECPHCGK